MKYNESQLREILKVAEEKALVAAKARLDEIKGNHSIVVSNGTEVVGTMHDLCGFAYCKIPVKHMSRRSKAVKALIADRTLSYWEYDKALTIQLPYIDQGISINEAAAKAASEYLNSLGIPSYVTSNLD